MIINSSLAKDHYFYVASHGIAGTDRVYRLWAPYYYIKDKKIINTVSTIFYPIITLNYHDSFRHSSVIGGNLIAGKIRFVIARTIRGWYFNANVAQNDDVLVLKNAIEKFCAHDPDVKCIIQGVSRGASVVIPLLALYPHLPIAAVILESPFDDIDSVLDNVIAKFGNMTILKRYKHTLFKTIFRRHNFDNEYTPISFTDRINQDIPILIVCSFSDYLVPWQSSIRLYNRLKQSGHKKVHLVLLSKGIHGFLILGKDKKIYESTVHSFYKKYNLPYDPSKADYNETFLI